MESKSSFSRAIDAHTTEFMLCMLAIPFLWAYWATRDQLLGTILGGLVGGVLAICQKRIPESTNVENIEKVVTSEDSK